MRRTIGPLLALLTLTGAYLYGFPAPTLAYGAGVVAHVLGGLAATVLLVLLARTVGAQSWPARLGWAATGSGASPDRHRQDRRDAPLPAAREGPHRPQHARHRHPRGGARGATGRPPIFAEQGFRLRESLRRTAAASAEAVEPCTRLLTAFSPSPRSWPPPATAPGTARGAVAPGRPDPEPDDAAAGDDAGRPRREGPVLPELDPHARWPEDQEQLLHGLAGLRALSR